MSNINVIKKAFNDRSKQVPIFYVHSHDFTGSAAYELKSLLRECQKEGVHLVVDGSHRSNGTHPDMHVLAESLNLSPEQKDCLEEYSRHAHTALALLRRFDSRHITSDPNDPWPGGTASSDVTAANTVGITYTELKKGQAIAYEVAPLERPVTPASEYLNRMALSIMTNPDIEKTAEGLKEFLEDGGSLNLAKPILLGLYKWDTESKRPDIVDLILSNQENDLDTALEEFDAGKSTLERPSNLSDDEFAMMIGFGKSSDEFLKLLKTNQDLTPLLLAPEILHGNPESVKPGTVFDLMANDGSAVSVEFVRRSEDKDTSIVTFKFLGYEIAFSEVKSTGNYQVNVNLKADADNRNHFGAPMGGKLEKWDVKQGDKVQAGQNVGVMFAMKMETTMRAQFDGVIKAIHVVSGENYEQGDLLFEIEPYNED